MLAQAPERLNGQVAIRPRYDHFIGGQWTGPVRGQYFDNLSPLTGKPVCQIARGTAEDIEAALDAAHKAREAWGRTSLAERSRAWAGAGGAGAGVNSYGPWGEPGTRNSGRFGFTGQVWIADARLYHYKARAYSPWLDRFLQPDPIGYEDGLNWYAYVANDPVNVTDPTGEFAWAGGAINAAIEAATRTIRRGQIARVAISKSARRTFLWGPLAPTSPSGSACRSSPSGSRRR